MIFSEAYVDICPAYYDKTKSQLSPLVLTIKVNIKNVKAVILLCGNSMLPSVSPLMATPVSNQTSPHLFEHLKSTTYILTHPIHTRPTTPLLPIR